MAYIPEKKTESLWWRDGVIYQIYPRSFADSNGDGIGDLKGILRKLDYLASLGIAGIWLSPIFPSPDFDFGYDVADYLDIDPKFGTLADYRQLVAEAHQRGIRVIQDLVLNHTSALHPWFQEARKSKENPYHDYYLWRDPAPNGGKPNNWVSMFSQKNAWEYVEACGQYYYHMFAVEQADLNWRNPKVYAEMMDIFRFWAEMGTDGFRLDVFNMYFKDADFRDNPKKFDLQPFHRQEHVYDCDRPEMDQAVRDIRKVTDAYPERFVVGETFLSTDEKVKRYCGEDKLHTVFDFAYTHCQWDAPSFRKIIQNVEAVTRDAIWPTYVFNNHDVERTSSRIGLGESDERLKQAAALTILLRGTPFLYYGEEIGMRQTKLKRADLMDPVGKNLWPFHPGRDGSRAPMQWNSQANGGFTSGTPWNALHPNYTERNVNALQPDPRSILTFYKELIALRAKNRSLQVGDLTMVDEKNEAVLAFTRKFDSQMALIALNFSQLPQAFVPGLSGVRWTKKFSNLPEKLPDFKDDKVTLAGEQVVVWIGNQPERGKKDA